MVEILKMLGQYLSKQTALPYDIQPSHAYPEDPHLVIRPDQLEIQTLHTLDEAHQVRLIGIDVLLELVAQGNNLEFLDAVLNASMRVNDLFGEYFNITLGKSAMGFSVAITKQQNGRFNPNNPPDYPYRFSETWKAELILKRGVPEK